jgi:hypothetical protein
VAAASRNNADQILGVLLESFSLERIDLVADDADYRHCSPLSGRHGLCIAAKNQRRAQRRNAPKWLRDGLCAQLMALLDAHSAVCPLTEMNNSSTVKL